MKKLLELLIPHYEIVINSCTKETSIDHIYKILSDTYTEHGICETARELFNEEISKKEWVKRYADLETNRFWHELPSICETKKEILSALQVRLDIMKEILLDHKDGWETDYIDGYSTDTNAGKLEVELDKKEDIVRFYFHDDVNKTIFESELEYEDEYGYRVFFIHLNNRIYLDDIR